MKVWKEMRRMKRMEEREREEQIGRESGLE